MTRGAQARKFWIGGIVLGILAPAAIVYADLATGLADGVVALAGLLALIGLFSYEDAYVRAGQSVPLS